MSSFKKQTGKDIQVAFELFHKANPEVFLLIIDQCKRAILLGKKKFSVKQIIGFIRWEIHLKTDEPTIFSDGKRFKINDAYTSRYARELVTQYPDYTQYIDLRELRS